MNLLQAALVVTGRDRNALRGIVTLLLVILLAPALIVTALAAVLSKVPAASDDDIARFRAAVEAVNREKDVSIDWREVVAAATVVCSNDFSNAPEPDSLIEAWIEEIWVVDPPGSPPVVHFAVRSFVAALTQLGFSQEEIDLAHGYLETLMDRGD